MELLPLIRQLLYLEDCMIIPGLGGFTSRLHPARVIAETGTIIPPAREIVFIADLKQNDGLLQNRIASDKGITQEEARQLIEDFTVELSHKARSGEKVIIDGIGYFYAGTDGQILFRMDPGVNLLLDSFGLSPVHFHRLTPAASKEIVTPPTRRTDNLGKAYIKRPDTRRELSENHPLKRVMIAIPLLLLLALLPNNSQVDRLLKHNTASMAPEPSLFLLKYPENQLKEKAREIIYPMSSDSIVPGPVDETVPEAEVAVADESPVVQPATGRYPLIAGSFRIESNALRYAGELTRKGYAVSVKVAGNGLHHVYMGPFAGIREAQDRLNKIYRADPSMSLWIEK